MHASFLIRQTHSQKTHSKKKRVAIETLYNEERRLGDQRGSDTLVVPFVTSNDGLSIAFLTRYANILSLQILLWLELVSSDTLAILLFRMVSTDVSYFHNIIACKLSYHSLKHSYIWRALDFRSFALNSGEM